MNSAQRKCLAFIFALFVFNVATAQEKAPPLERAITIRFSNEKVTDALKKIEAAAKVNFSYKSSLINKDQRVSGDFTNLTVREILDHLFEGKIEYRERGKYIILIKAESTSSSESTLSGYVIDEATGKRLRNVSVYDPVSLNSTVTDSYGYFKIDVKNPTGEEIKLAINKREYVDTVVVVPRRNQRLLSIPIKFDKEKIGVLADSVGKKIKRFFIATKEATEQAVNIENITDTIYRTSQFSVVPFVGTNGKLSGNVINDYSLNLFGGYSLGNRKAEVAGLFNATRGNISGFQAAGLANGVTGEQSGFQVAGLANGSLDTARGFQLAGLGNVNIRPGTGLRVAGVGNFMMEGSSATHAAGVFNFVIGEQRQPQLAGGFNFTTKDVRPAQIAGLFNFTAGSLEGAQVAGTINIVAEDMRGAQISGVLNIAPKTMRGVQVGLINFGRWSDGVQVGFLNISGRMKGVPIGFLSIVGNGYHKLELSADEIFYTNIAFRSGLRKFYNILTVGANPETFEDDKSLWSFGYGIGTAPKLSRRLFLNFDLTSNQIVYGNKVEEINLVNKLYGGLDFQITKGFSITAGVTLNGQVTDVNYAEYPDIFINYKPDIIHESNFGNDLNLKMWWGAKAGLRFF